MNTTISAAVLHIEADETMRELFIAVLEEAQRQEAAGNTDLADKLDRCAKDAVLPAWEKVNKIMRAKPKRVAK
jgi:hypothetical protein